MTDHDQPPSRTTRVALRLATFAIAAALAGPLAAHLRLVAPFSGFLTMLLGLLLAVVAAVLALVGLVRDRGRGRQAATLALMLGLTVVAAVLIAGREGRRYPRINDITTDPVHPPAFVHAPTLPANAGRDMSYPGEGFARQQREGYGEIAPLATTLAPAEAFRLVEATARAMPTWTVTRVDPSARTLEGVDTSWLFHFQDDLVIEVREEGGATRVHMRSKSRVGKGDQGANAKRIAAFFAALRAQPGWR